MAERYFQKFNTIDYNGKTAINLTQRTELSNTSLANPLIYYQVDNNLNQRPDLISYNVYDDQYLSWLIYYANKTIDPYYDWYLSEAEFNKYLIKKYNYSINILTTMIKYYKNDWENGHPISTDTYNNLSDSLKKYWEPNYGNENNTPLNYTRKQVNWLVNTNQIVSFNTTANTYIKDEVVNVVYSDNSVGKAQVEFSNNTNLILKNVSGYVSNSVSGNTNGYVYGTLSYTNSTFNTVNLISKNISDQENLYWRAISVYDYERGLNENNKSYKLVKPSLAKSAAQQLKDLLNT